MIKNGQFAAIQPMVPQSRTLPNCEESFKFANVIEFATDTVGTYAMQCSHISAANEGKSVTNARPIIDKPPTKCAAAMYFSAANFRSTNDDSPKSAISDATGNPHVMMNCWSSLKLRPRAPM